MGKTGQKPRTDIDWEAIQREYRVGVLSVREIASMFGVSHTAIQKRAKKDPEHWQRDLTAKIKAAVARKLAELPVAEKKKVVSTIGDEDSIVEEASTRVMEVIKKHQTCIAKTAEIEAGIFAALKEQEKKPKGKDEKQPAVSTRATTLLALVTAQERRIRLERQAFGIADDARPPGEQITEIPLIFDTARRDQ